MDRSETIALLKEIISLGLAQPSAVYVRNNKGEYELIIKSDCNSELIDFITKKGLMLRQRDDLNVCIIYKP